MIGKDMKKIIGKFMGVSAPFMATMWTIFIKTKKGIKRFVGDWRPFRDMIEGLELKKGDRVIVNFQEEWEWSISRAV